MSRTAFVGLGAVGGAMASGVARKLLAIAAYDIALAALARVGSVFVSAFGPVFVSASSGWV
ncbi:MULTISPECIES: hypothetical protein [Actibacterium]|uniref:3-hydroxyisobutyrate dehydrogenase-like beta-hydroxyacid dehydrogenase n=1 Tax=Actibacterium naphthalenivorans TaxID=1614693 RepID=A0A840CHL1_9RHOB|nr:MULTISPECIES: hypothetical protein [Actibacterium]ALG92275.1 hypothetical protein TQ29_18825 [Actibacterium sp. EMB200-NS6]MBB4023602.1 3-hydroxyisobutyrate dehydrogenase-like beta-hydroxyacid dehydrogenase [Actibacterium naphthalenivorans]